MTPDYFRQLAAYNKWANKRLYDAMLNISTQDYYGERPSFFGSIHNTLNHILFIDQFWQERIDTGRTSNNDLRTIVAKDFDVLNRMREYEDNKIIKRMDNLMIADMQKTVSYKTTDGQSCATPLWQILAHFFNHQTHHRGQVHGMLSQIKGAEPPELDLMYFFRESEKSA